MNTVRIRDVAPRLTFQAQPATTEQKVELVDRLTAAGITAVEVSSFVRPDLVPGLADAAEVFARVQRPAGVSLECCIGNQSGLVRAVDAGAHKAWFLLSADEEFSRNNTGRSIDESLAVLERLRAEADGTGTTVGTYLIFAWGGPLGTPRRPEDLEPLLRRLREIGVDDWILADSCGYASPVQIRETVAFAAEINAMDKLTVQVHDSRGMGVANVAELARMGLRNIDTSLAGAGGHPAVPGARAGGVCTEDAVQLLERSDVATGVDLRALIDAANWFDEILGGGEGGFVRRTGAVPRTAADVDPQRGEFAWSR
ncbi:pyruvate carboxyltransferase [Rhodococcus sp. NPDC127593]|uniref:pyruvate carboxyltransferase n=1 Tax=Rhodococcus sp. NPDC127593 TaxID=3345404 RepID=UPI00364110D2